MSLRESEVLCALSKGLIKRGTGVPWRPADKPCTPHETQTLVKPHPRSGPVALPALLAQPQRRHGL